MMRIKVAVVAFAAIFLMSCALFFATGPSELGDPCTEKSPNCPENSGCELTTISGGVCTCDYGYIEKNKKCVPRDD